jgi:predicted O-linked N-acetylglucosamine transferase (SPINDLY family)
MADPHKPHGPNEAYQAATRAFSIADWSQAEALCRDALRADPTHVGALALLGIVLSQTDRLQEAAETARQAVDLQPGNAVLWTNLGGIHTKLGRSAKAIECHLRAIALHTGFPEAHYNLSLAYRALSQLDNAIAAVQRAIQLRPDYANAYYTLGELLHDAGRLAESATAYQAAIGISPDWPEAHYYLGAVWLELDLPVQAAEEFQQVLRLNPQSSSAEHALGHALRLLGRIEEARAAYARAAEIDGRSGRRDPVTLLLGETLAELVPPHRAYIAEYREGVARAVRAFARSGGKLELSTVHTDGPVPNAMLAYYGGDVRPIMEQYAEAIAPHILRSPLRPRQGKPKLGLVVTAFSEGVFARCWGGIAERLSRELFDVKLVCSQKGLKLLPGLLKIDRHEYVALPTALDQAARLLEEQNFDWLHYWEIGNDVTNYCLPFFRTAPGQSGCWGWPITSGNSLVDAYLSCEQIEPPDGASHYTEQLVPLKRFPTYYLRPSAPVMPSRSAFGLDERHVYLCVQNLRKYHPDIDPLLADILRRDPEGELVIIGDELQTVTELLLERFRRTISDVVSRVRVLPRMKREPYLALVALADVMLDTLHYGGGANTVYDAVAMGTPIVTLPGKFHRSRWAAAVNRRLGLEQLIAGTPEDYVAKAVEVATNRDLRESLRKQILGAGAELFEDPAVVREHEEFFSRAIAATRAAQ